MTYLMFGLGVLLIGTTVRLIVHAAVLPRLQISLHLRQIEGYGFEGAERVGYAPSGMRLSAAIGKLAEWLGKVAMERVPALPPLERGELAAAAYYEVSPEAVHGYRALAAISFPVVILLFTVSTGGLSMIVVLIAAAGAVAGWQLPAIVIRSKGRSRLEQIDRDLPELIDVLTATVEAGMGFGGSVGLVAKRFKGALGEELRLTLQQQTLGISNEQALNDLVERCDTPAIRSFVRTVTRGESMGVSIGPILRELATEVRNRRRQSAKEKMQKAPVKILFPLMLLIFPALIIELMFPAGYMLLHSLH